ncbi:MAG: DUF1643 domain-containing protein [Pseudomonadota bacterium]
MSLIRRHDTAEGWRQAVYSDCERYRYSLTVLWADGGRRLLYVMLNPSKATELANDPTIERCERRARQLGYGAFQVVNLFALRETSPQRLKKARKPEGPENATAVSEGAAWCDDILAAWGVHGVHRNQDEIVLKTLKFSRKPLLTLGLTKDGHPRHPLYIPYKKSPDIWV